MYSEICGQCYGLLLKHVPTQLHLDELHEAYSKAQAKWGTETIIHKNLKNCMFPDFICFHFCTIYRQLPGHVFVK